MLPFKCFLDHIYEHSLINGFILHKDFSECNKNVSSLMPTARRKANDCIPKHQSCSVRNRRAFDMAKRLLNKMIFKMY